MPPAPRNLHDTPEPAGRQTLLHRILRTVLGLFSEPRINMRKDYEKVRRFQRTLAAPRAVLNRAVDHDVPSEYGAHKIPVRVFHPKQQTRQDVLIFFHGGGWVTGDLDSYTPTCMTMADLTGAVVVSVDYRLAPEHPFPAGLQDCYQIVQRLLEDPTPAGVEDPKNIVLIGDSAGANLVAVVSLLLQQEGLVGASRQILLYPVTNWEHDPKTSPFDSVREHGTDLRLTNAEIQAYFDLYVPDPTDRQNWKIAPLLAQNLANQPNTLIITAELDLLRDEGEAYGKALKAAGNKVLIHRVDGALHGFIGLPRVSRSVREAYDRMNSFLDQYKHPGQL